jgi:hypothetical protein
MRRYSRLASAKCLAGCFCEDNRQKTERGIQYFCYLTPPNTSIHEDIHTLYMYHIYESRYYGASDMVHVYPNWVLIIVYEEPENASSWWIFSSIA